MRMRVPFAQHLRASRDATRGRSDVHHAVVVAAAHPALDHGTGHTPVQGVDETEVLEPIRAWTVDSELFLDMRNDGSRIAGSERLRDFIRARGCTRESQSKDNQIARTRRLARMGLL